MNCVKLFWVVCCFHGISDVSFSVMSNKCFVETRWTLSLFWIWVYSKTQLNQPNRKKESSCYYTMHFLWTLEWKCILQPFLKCMFSRRTTIITSIEHCNPIWFNNTKMSCGTLPQQKLKASGLASTGSNHSAVSWFAGGLRSAAALEVDNRRQRRQPRGSARRPSEPSITGARWQVSLSLPRLTFIFLSHLPSLSLPVSSHQPPLCDAQGGILQLLSAYCLCTRAKTHTRTFARVPTVHTGMSTQGWKLAQKPPNKQAGRTATRAVGKRCHSVSISAN